MKIDIKFIRDILAMLFCTIVYSGLNMLVLMFINEEILHIRFEDGALLVKFGLILLLFLIFAMLSRAILAFIGHDFVYRLRLNLVKNILNTPYLQIQKISRARLEASLSSDISSLSSGFSAFPEAVQGIFVTFFIFGYMFYLSFAISLFVLVWLIVTLLVGWFFMKKTYLYFQKHRCFEDKIYKNYQTAIDAHKELSLSEEICDEFYEKEFRLNALDLKTNIIKANTHLAFVSNWFSVMILGAIGAIFYLSLTKGAASIETALTISLAVLFMRSPLVLALSTLPNIAKARIALNNIKSLKLQTNSLPRGARGGANWQKIELKDIKFSYDQVVFSGLNLQINRGEILFLTGQNGGGKSSLAMIICAIIREFEGEIYLDDQLVTNRLLRDYKGNISAVFSDFYLFDELSYKDELKAQNLLEKFALSNKVMLKNGKFSTINLSDGQKKRLALISALLQEKTLLVLDEWAAQQDPKFKRYFYEELLVYIKELGYTVLAITHDESYFELADRVYVMEDGNLKLKDKR